MAMWKTEEVPGFYLMALCAWREARGCSDEAIRGVLHVIHNRARHPSWWGNGLLEVLLKPKQFSCFNPKDPNASKIPAAGDTIFWKIIRLAEQVEIGADDDLTGGAVLYHSVDAHPDWADQSIQAAKILPFIFYREHKA